MERDDERSSTIVTSDRKFMDGLDRRNNGSQIQKFTSMDTGTTRKVDFTERVWIFLQEV